MTSFNSPFTGNVIQPTDVAYRSITLSANVTLEWPINGTDTSNYAARIMQVTATSGGLSIAMPPANQASVGQDALFRNVGSNAFTVTDYNGNTIITINAGESKYIYITTNSTTAGTWGIIAFGTGSSSADAATLAGAGLLASGLTLNQSHPSSGFSTGYTFTAADRALMKLWVGGVGTATLPAASVLGDNWFTLIKNGGTGTMTVSTTSPDSFDGSSSKAFAPGESAFIVCDGTNYYTVGYGVSSQFQFSALVKSVTTGAYTLTATEAANTIQEYVGTLTGNVTVTYPPVVSLYVIANQTTAAGHTFTVTTGVPGGANATIASGQQATLVCDGTNFFNANTVQAGATSISIVNGSAATPAINFASETSTGIFRPGSGQFGVSILGNLVLNVSATGITVTGSGTFTGGVQGGTF